MIIHILNIMECVLFALMCLSAISAAVFKVLSVYEDKKNADKLFVIIKKDGKEIFLLARPSDGGEVRIFYETEKDLLDYSMDWELWVEDGKNEPQKITFGKIIKLTGLNRIPLKGM